MTKTLHICRPREFQWTRFGMNRPSSCCVLASARFQVCSLHLWARPCGPIGQMTMILHMHRPGCCQWTWLGVNRPSYCWVMASIRFQEHSWCLWEHACGPDWQMAMMLHIYRPRWLQWTWFRVNQPGAFWVLSYVRFQDHSLHLWECTCGPMGI